MAFMFSDDRVQKELAMKSRRLVDVENQLQLQKAETDKLLKENDRLQQQIKQQSEAMVALQNQRAASTRLGGAAVAAALAAGPPLGTPTPKGPLSRQGSSSTGSESPSDGSQALKASLAAKEREVEELTQKLAQLETAAKAVTQRSTELTSPRDSGFKVVGNGLSGSDASRLSALRSECETWKARSESMSAELREAQRKVDALQVEHRALEERCALLSEQKVAAQDQVRDLRAELAALRSAADHSQREAKSVLTRRDSDMVRLRADQDRSAEQIDELQAALDRQVQDRARLEQGILNLEGEVARQKALVQEANTEAAQLGKLAEEKAVALEALTAELRDVNATLRSKQAQCEELMVKLVNADKEKAALETEYRTLATAQGEMADGAEALRSQLRVAQDRVEVAELAMAGSKQQVVDLQKQLDAKEREVAAAVAALDERMAMCEELQRTATASVEGRQLAADGAGKLEEQLREAHGLLDARNATITELTAALDAAQAEAKQKSQAVVDLTAQLQEAMLAVDSVRTRMEGETEELRRMNAQLMSPAELLEQEVKALKAQLADAEHARDASANQAQELQGKLSEMRGTVQQANGQITDLGARLEELRAALAEKDEQLEAAALKLAQVDGLLSQKHALQRESDDKETALKMSNGQFNLLSEQLEEKEAQLRERVQALDLARQAVAEKDRRIAALERDAAQQTASISMLQLQLKDREAECLEAEKNETTTQMLIADLKTELRSKEMEAQDLSRDLLACKKEAVHTQTIIRRLEGEVEAAKKKIEALTDALEQANAGHEADKEIRRMLDEARVELAAERVAHARTCKLLLAEQERFEELGREGALSPRTAADMRQQVLAAEEAQVQAELAASRREATVAPTPAPPKAAAAAGLGTTAEAGVKHSLKSPIMAEEAREEEEEEEGMLTAREGEPEEEGEDEDRDFGSASQTSFPMSTPTMTTPRDAEAE